MNFVGLLDLLSFLTHPLAVIGSILGLLLGFLGAAALHWLFPFQSLAGAQALLLAAGFVAGLIVGHFGDERFVRKK